MSELSNEDIQRDYILYVRTGQVSNIKILFEVLKEVLLSDINLIFSPSSIKVTQQDGTKKAMVHLNLRSDAFEFGYYCSEEFLPVGINTSNFYKVIKLATSKDIISFYIKRNKMNRLFVVFTNGEAPEIQEHDFEILNLDAPFIEIPRIDYSSTGVEIEMSSSKFQKKMKNMNSLGIDCNVEITSIGEQVIFNCEGDFSKNKFIFGSSEDVSFGETNRTIIQGVYPLKFLILFCKATSLHPIVTICLKNDYPIILKYPVGPLGDLKFILKNI